MRKQRKIRITFQTIIIIAVVAITSIATIGFIFIQKKSTDLQVSANYSCSSPALKQIIIRTERAKQTEYTRWIPINQGKIIWANSFPWKKVRDYPGISIVDIAHSQYEQAHVWKYTLKKVNRIYQPALSKIPLINGIADETHTATEAWNLPWLTDSMNVVAFSNAYYDNAHIMKFIIEENGKYYARVRTYTNYLDPQTANLKDSKSSLDTWPGSGKITAFNEAVYDNKLNQKLVRDGQIYVRTIPMSSDGSVNFSNTTWVKNKTVAESGWPGTGTVTGFSEYLDCMPPNATQSAGVM